MPNMSHHALRRKRTMFEVDGERVLVSLQEQLIPMTDEWYAICSQHIPLNVFNSWPGEDRLLNSYGYLFGTKVAEYFS